MLTPAIRATLLLLKAKLLFDQGKANRPGRPRRSRRRALYCDSPPRQCRKPNSCQLTLALQIKRLTLDPGKHALDLPGHRIGFGHAVHPLQQPLLLVVRQDRRSLLAIGLEPRLHRLRIVVLAPGELRPAAYVAHARLLRLLERVVIAGAACGAGIAAGDALDQRVLDDRQFDHAVDLLALPPQ